MPLLRIPQPFDHEDFIYELKLDGFRALAFVEDGRCRLVSRNGYEFARWESLKSEIARSVQCRSAVLDGEIVCLDADGRRDFYALPFRRRAPHFRAFDALSINGRDLRGLPLLKRKQQLFDVMPRTEARVRYVDYIHERGIELFRLACERDLEGIVAKWQRATYQSEGRGTSWLKIKMELTRSSRADTNCSCNDNQASASHTSALSSCSLDAKNAETKARFSVSQNLSPGSVTPLEFASGT